VLQLCSHWDCTKAVHSPFHSAGGRCKPRSQSLTMANSRQNHAEPSPQAEGAASSSSECFFFITCHPGLEEVSADAHQLL
jgi:hypothetical protein